MAYEKQNFVDGNVLTADNLNRMEEGIAAAASHVEDKNNPHGVTPARIGAAPAGYGYGDALPTVTGATDAEFLSNIEALCREKISSSTFQAIIYPPGSAFDGYSFIAEIWHKTDTSGNKFIKIKAHGVTTTWAFQRVCYMNTWSEPEWVNPPMQLGVEYRTTERWNGKVVWTQLIDFGALPNNTLKLKSCASFTQLCDSVCNVTDGTYYSNANKEPWVTGFNVSSGQILLRTNTDVSAYTATVQLWYVKD